MPSAYIGLGANLGQPEQQLRAAVDCLGEIDATRVIRCSKLYRTPPWGQLHQPPFVNAVAELSTALAPVALLDALLHIERRFGRDRVERWGPRVLDLDLLLYDDAIIEREGLRVPHPHMHERAFVLVPLAEIASACVIPGQGQVQTLLQRLDCAAVEALG